ncbi:MAG: PilW family protein [Sulfuricaulis sp.]|uniref:PilW family protein n=1 Tax=Sulfuricaulis sp. TaxID=2003553 RepID=UPI003C46E88D
MKSFRQHMTENRGFSLVELMVALTIGLIILSAVSMLFVGSKKTYTAQDSLARLQENARFAMQFLTKDLRLAGYYGCISDIAPDSVYSTLNNSTDFAYNAQVPLEGLNHGTGTWYPSASTTLPSGIVSGTDAITIRVADAGSSIFLTNEMSNKTDGLTVNSVSDISSGDIIMVSDCASTDIMNVTGFSGLQILHAPGSGNPSNSTQTLSKVYSPSTGPGGTRVMKFWTRRYFIGTGASGNPALFRQDNNGTAVELVDGIENMRIQYGEYTASPSDANRSNWVPSVYRNASAVSDWTKVVSVRIGILARTLSDSATGRAKETDIDTGNYDIDGDGNVDLSNPGDHFKRRIFQYVVQLRNAL